MECVGRCVTGVGYAPYKFTIIGGKRGRYIPDLALVEAGRAHLQSAQQNGAPGIWLSAKDVAGINKNLKGSPNYPWLPVLRVRGEAFADDLCSIAHKAVNSDLPMVIPVSTLARDCRAVFPHR